MIDRGLNWATTLGNHDSQADLTRQEVAAVDASYDLSLTSPSTNLTHATNYMLPVYDQLV